MKATTDSILRWCYYIYLIMMGPAIVLQFLYYWPPSFKQLHGNTRTVMQELKRVDSFGALRVLLFVTGLALFLLGVSWGQFSRRLTSSELTNYSSRWRTASLDISSYSRSRHFWQPSTRRLCLLG